MILSIFIHNRFGY